MKTALAVAVLLLSVSAGAKPVYKCEEKGQMTYTDQPCTPGASAATLPDPVITAPLTQAEQDLARANEARLAAERVERDRADAQWLKEHAERKARAERAQRTERERKARERKR